MNAEPSRQDVLAVDIATIENEWARLWRESTVATQANGGHPATRNSVLNLIVFTRRADLVTAVGSALGELAQNHPARVVVLLAQPDANQNEVKAWIDLSPYQQERRWGRNANEQALIMAKGESVNYLPEIVLPLLVANLPVFIWWADTPPMEHPLFARLARICDRMVIDSAEFESVGERFQMLASLSRSREYRCAVSDLNWQRSAPWRELAAQFFDPAPLQPYLGGISHIRIEYAGTEANGRTAGVANPAQALLLVGWAASKLGWTPSPGQQHHAAGTHRLTLRTRAGDTIAVEIRPRKLETNKKKPVLITGPEHLDESAPATSPAWMVSQTVAGALCTVTITSVHQGHTAVFSIRRSADYEHATTSCTIDGVPWGQERTVHLDSMSRRSLLHAELEAFGHDEDFENALTIAGALMA